MWGGGSMVNNSFYLYYIRKKLKGNYNNTNLHKKETKLKKKTDCDFHLRLNRRTSSLLICSLAFITRYMYYYKVSKVDIWEYLDKKDFNIIYNDLRYLMLYLDGKSEKLYKNYKNFKLYDKYKKH